MLRDKCFRFLEETITFQFIWYCVLNCAHTFQTLEMRIKFIIDSFHFLVNLISGSSIASFPTLKNRIWEDVNSAIFDHFQSKRQFVSQTPSFLKIWERARGFPPLSGRRVSQLGIPLVWSTMTLIIAQLLQGQVIFPSETWFQDFWCVLIPCHVLGPCHHPRHRLELCWSWARQSHNDNNGFHCSAVKHLLCQNNRHLIVCSHECHQNKNDNQSETRLCAFLWSALGWGFVLCWTVGSLPHCLRTGQSWGGTRSMESNTPLSECECDVQSSPRLIYWLVLPTHSPIVELVKPCIRKPASS